jgi:4-hydroxy-3-methylbut-2-enyl diphosphate reductase
MPKSELIPLTIYLAQPRGFCAGVERAIDIVEKALELYGAPVYVRHEIVHNKWVVDDLKAKGVIFVGEVDEIPAGAITVFSAHGISEKVENSAKLRDLPIIDATCPLVTKVHIEAQRYEKEGHTLILIGHKGHPEVEGTMGRVKNPVYLVESAQHAASLDIPPTDKLAYVTQTTLSVDDTRTIIDVLKKRFPHIQGPDVKDICYATQNRQNAVRELCKRVDMLLVIGAKNSSNSNRLRDLGKEIGTKSYLIDDEKQLNPEWLNGIGSIGITAGASAPEILVNQVIEHLKTLRSVSVKVMDGSPENVRFKLPPEVTGKVNLRAG